jgi:hypothetical protein
LNTGGVFHAVFKFRFHAGLDVDLRDFGEHAALSLF